jgi:hypothetical protein
MAAPRLATTLRTSRAQSIVTAAGAGAKGLFYNGAIPAGGAVPAGTLLATVTFGAVLGAVTAGVIDFDEASITQVSGTFTDGTPTLFRITDSSNVFVVDIDVNNGAGSLTMDLPIVTGYDIDFTTMTWTEGNAG